MKCYHKTQYNPGDNNKNIKYTYEYIKAAKKFLVW